MWTLAPHHLMWIGPSSNQRRKFDVSALQICLCIFRSFLLPLLDVFNWPEGAIHLFALTSYTDACIPSALCSEKSLRCSPATLISAQTLSSSIGEPRSMAHRPHFTQCIPCTKRCSPVAKLDTAIKSNSPYICFLGDQAAREASV